jgi:hypothetical protein
MNVLTFKVTDTNGLSFKLYVDGKPLVKKDTSGDEITSWYCEEGVPTYPPYESDARRIMLGNCDCGEYGCGNTNAEIERSDEMVYLSNFAGDGHLGLIPLTFSKSNFDDISRQICDLAIAHKNEIEK